jgi:hypothetical protein
LNHQSIESSVCASKASKFLRWCGIRLWIVSVVTFFTAQKKKLLSVFKSFFIRVGSHKYPGRVPEGLLQLTDPHKLRELRDFSLRRMPIGTHRPVRTATTTTQNQCRWLLLTGRLTPRLLRRNVIRFSRLCLSLHKKIDKNPSHFQEKRRNLEISQKCAKFRNFAQFRTN